MKKINHLERDKLIYTTAHLSKELKGRLLHDSNFLVVYAEYFGKTKPSINFMETKLKFVLKIP